MPKPGVLGFSLLALAAAHGPARASDIEAVLSVPGRALVFEGLGLQAPDTEGHFTVGVRLPQPNLQARRCDERYLVVGMGTLNKPEARLTPDDRRRIARAVLLYQRLRARAGRGEAISLPVRNRADHLQRRGRGLIAPYCILSIDERRAHD